MTTKTTKFGMVAVRFALVGALLVSGCGEDKGAMGPSVGADATVGAGGQAGADATGGHAALGTGGAMGGAVGTTFTRDDHGRCGNFPVCPDGIVGNPDQYKLRVLPEQCRADFNWPGSCGACVDTRTAACAPFVGACVAPNWPQNDVDFCQNRVAPVNPGGIGWTICTGAAQDPGGNAQLVCAD